MARRRVNDWDDWWRMHGERELRCILMTGWDPVGAADAPEAWDEYDDYALGVASRLRNADPDTAETEVLAYLQHVERDLIGIGQTTQRVAHTAYVASALVAWHEFSYEHGSRPREWID